MGESVEIRPRSAVKAVVHVPGSKSLTNRALVAAALAHGKTVLEDVLIADDTMCMLEALEKLSFELRADEPSRKVTVNGSGGNVPAKSCDIYAHQAGTVMRFLSALVSLGQGPYRLDGDERMRQRPIGPLVDALRSLGADITYEAEDGFPPLVIKGGIKGGRVTVDASVSSQFVSALLLIGPVLSKGLKLKLSGRITSRPFIEMTLRLMRLFGADVSWVGEDTLKVEPKKYSAPSGGRYAVEGDATAASYFWAAAVITGGEVTVDNVPADGLQGDAAFADILGRMGARVTKDSRGITVTSGGSFNGITVDMNDIPDVVQTLAVAALFAKGKTRIKNVGNLRVKETDRLSALENELRRLGAKVIAGPDWIEIFPDESRLKGAALHTYGDHRMAMSLALAGLRVPGVVIEEPGCVSKTFPEFFEVLERL